MLTPRALASSTVLRMMSASPAWKPQAMLTEVASSIMASSLPITQGPKLSPRSQLRSMLLMLFAFSRFPPLILNRWVPGVGVDRTDGVARDIRVMQRLDVELRAFEAAQAIRQGAQQLRKFLRLRLRLGHADRLEAETGSGRGLRQPAEVGGDHGCDLGIAAGSAAVRHQHDRRTIAGDLDAAIHGTVGYDVVAVQMFYHRALQPVAHAVAGRGDFPFAVEKELFGLVGKFIVLRPKQHPNLPGGSLGQFDPPLRRTACGFCRQLVAGLERALIGAAETCAGVHREAAEHGLAGDAA